MDLRVICLAKLLYKSVCPNQPTVKIWSSERLADCMLLPYLLPIVSSIILMDVR